MGIIAQLFKREHEAEPVETDAQEPAAESFAFGFDIEKALLNQLRRLGWDPGTHIAVALRAYLPKLTRPLPFEDLTREPTTP